MIQIAARVSFVTATAPAHVVEFLEDSDPSTVRILVAAHDEFTEHGVRATTMNKVAERAGLGVATVYRRFPQKAVLVQETSLGAAYFLDPKVIASYVMWGLYVLLLFLRQSAGLRGRRAAYLSGAVLAVMLCVWAANMVSHVHRFGAP